MRSRVRSYFGKSSKLGTKTQNLVRNISKIDHIKVNSDVEALLLESQLIKRNKPPYNISSKDDSSPYYIHITKEKWPRPIINHQRKGSIAGPFLNRHIPKKILRLFRKISPYCLSKRPVTKPCLYSHIKLCDPCPGFKKDSDLIRYHKNITKLKSLLKGKLSKVSVQLRQEMLGYSSKQNFERAQEIKKNIQALEFIKLQTIHPEEYIVNPNLIDDKRDFSLSSLRKILNAEHNPLHRIEMYDVAHLSGTSAAASMTVAINGEVNPKYFRHFRIKYSKSNSDVDMMYETISRRLKRKDWPTPDLIVLDGGKSQLSIIKRLSPNISNLPMIIGLAKKFETIVVPNNSKFVEIHLPKSHKGLLLLMHLRDEAHRFSRRLHLNYRQRSILT